MTETSPELVSEELESAEEILNVLAEIMVTALTEHKKLEAADSMAEKKQILGRIIMGLKMSQQVLENRKTSLKGDLEPELEENYESIRGLAIKYEQELESLEFMPAFSNDNSRIDNLVEEHGTTDFTKYITTLLSELDIPLSSAIIKGDFREWRRTGGTIVIEAKNPELPEKLRIEFFRDHSFMQRESFRDIQDPRKPGAPVGYKIPWSIRVGVVPSNTDDDIPIYQWEGKYKEYTDTARRDQELLNEAQKQAKNIKERLVLKNHITSLELREHQDIEIHRYIINLMASLNPDESYTVSNLAEDKGRNMPIQVETEMRETGVVIFFVPVTKDSWNTLVMAKDTYEVIYQETDDFTKGMINGPSGKAHKIIEALARHIYGESLVITAMDRSNTPFITELSSPCNEVQKEMVKLLSELGVSDISKLNINGPDWESDAYYLQVDTTIQGVNITLQLTENPASWTVKIWDNTTEGSSKKIYDNNEYIYINLVNISQDINQEVLEYYQEELQEKLLWLEDKEEKQAVFLDHISQRLQKLEDGIEWEADNPFFLSGQKEVRVRISWAKFWELSRPIEEAVRKSVKILEMNEKELQKYGFLTPADAVIFLNANKDGIRVYKKEEIEEPTLISPQSRNRQEQAHTDQSRNRDRPHPVVRDSSSPIISSNPSSSQPTPIYKTNPSSIDYRRQSAKPEYRTNRIAGMAPRMQSALLSEECQQSLRNSINQFLKQVPNPDVTKIQIRVSNMPDKNELTTLQISYPDNPPVPLPLHLPRIDRNTIAANKIALIPEVRLQVQQIIQERKQR